jgi:pimeloyl-ACP methyl ester carboxylesterase
VYFYPSGLPIGASALLLAKKIDDLGSKYNLDSLYLVAHSMGGLVTRSALVDFGYEYLPYVKLFVSISTPWGGEETARSAVNHNVLMVPAWKDMVPDSRFLNHIFSKSIPDRIEYYLLFSHKGRGASFRGNTDGAVTLASQLDSGAQKESLRTVGFDEDHDSILCSKEMADQLNAIFRDVDQRAGKRPERTPVTVILKHPDEASLPRQMYLWLLPEDSNERDSVITLTPKPSDKIVVMVAPGAYQAGLVAPGFVSSPQTVSLTAATGKNAETSFNLRPDGQIYGYIGSALANDEIHTGTDQQPTENIRIERIRLEGNHISRVMDSTHYANEGIYRAWIKNEDYLDKSTNSYVFFNLPAGDYTLEIQAEGYELYQGRYHVVPGQLEPTKALRLTPKI